MSRRSNRSAGPARAIGAAIAAMDVAGIAYTIHGWLPWLLAAVLIAHIAGVIKHHRKDRYPLIRRMWLGKHNKEDE